MVPAGQITQFIPHTPLTFVVPAYATQALTPPHAPRKMVRCSPLQPFRRFLPPNKLRWLTVLILLLASMWAGSRGVCYDSAKVPRFDSSIFSSIGWHIVQGKVLYRDMWDHKPPMIMFLNAAAMWVGETSIDSVRQMERLFGAVAAGLAFFIAWLIARRAALAALAAVLVTMMLYSPNIFQGGNLTEEYGIVFMLAGIAAAVASRQTASRRWTNVLVVLCGIAMGCAILTKEPFLLTALPWVVLAAWPSPTDGRRPLRCLPLVAFGAALPLAVFVVYFLAHGALRDWMDAIAFNFGHADSATQTTLYQRLVLSVVTGFHLFTQISWLVMGGVVMGIVSLANREFRRRTQGLMIVALAHLALGLTAASLGGRNYGHYYIQLVPSMVMLAVFGVAFVGYLVMKVSPRHRVAIVASLILVVGALVALGEIVRLARPGETFPTTVIARQFTDFAGRLARPMARWEDDELIQCVRARAAGKIVWAPTRNANYVYPSANVLSPTSRLFVNWHLFVDTPASTGRQKCQQILGNLETHRPELIVLWAGWRKDWIPEGMEQVLRTNYELVEGLEQVLHENYELVEHLPIDAPNVEEPVVEIWQKR